MDYTNEHTEVQRLKLIFDSEDSYGTLAYLSEVIYPRVQKYMKKPGCRPTFEMQLRGY